MKDNISAKQLEMYLSIVGLSSHHISIIMKIWKKRSSIYSLSLLSKSISSNRLIDMDWSFGVSVCSNDSDQISKTFLQVKFRVESIETRGGVKDIFFELSLEQFYTFLAQMEKCKSLLDILNS